MLPIFIPTKFATDLTFNTREQGKPSPSTDSLTTTEMMFELSRSNENQDKNRQSIFERLIDGKFLPSDNLTVEMSKSSISSSMMNSENQNNGEQSSSRSGICFPYNDFFVMSSQILTFMATIALFMNTQTLFMSVGANVVHQIIVWSYHMNKISIRALPVVSFLASFAFVSHGMITLVTLILNTLEDISYMEQDSTVDGCTLEVNELIQAFTAFLGSIFWMGSFLCMNSFVERGRNAKWKALVLAAVETEHAKKKENAQIIQSEDKNENELISTPPQTMNNMQEMDDMIFIVESDDEEDDFLLAANETVYTKKKRRRKKKKDARRMSKRDENV